MGHNLEGLIGPSTLQHGAELYSSSILAIPTTPVQFREEWGKSWVPGDDLIPAPQGEVLLGSF